MITFTKVHLLLTRIVVLVGDAGVGKTNLISRYIKGTLPKVDYPTVGVEFATKNVPLKSGGIVKAQVWDTAGQERYQAITAAHYKRSCGAIIVYDITKASTFQNVKKWMVALRGNAGENIVIMLIGNKLDLVNRNPGARRVLREEAEEYAAKNKLIFQESSAVSNTNVKEAFEVLMEAIYNEQSKVGNKADETRGVSLTLTGPEEKPSGCCL
eukprot:TRINITY_DN1100_c0_g4_i1.p1 TRINITY_DN1100_c0_g4~~TRINITY_DN1100_c0_g4_i1.p1  ORF type:complete len:212 (-),score=64.36 TRINITY_DN1100_c0_g4_i1:79-714(-)